MSEHKNQRPFGKITFFLSERPVAARSREPVKTAAAAFPHADPLECSRPAAPRS
jgi:hypothetical protein